MLWSCITLRTDRTCILKASAATLALFPSKEPRQLSNGCSNCPPGQPDTPFLVSIQSTFFFSFHPYPYHAFPPGSQKQSIAGSGGVLFGWFEGGLFELVIVSPDPGTNVPWWHAAISLSSLRRLGIPQLCMLRLHHLQCLDKVGHLIELWMSNFPCKLCSNLGVKDAWVASQATVVNHPIGKGEQNNELPGKHSVPFF